MTVSEKIMKEIHRRLYWSLMSLAAGILVGVTGYFLSNIVLMLMGPLFIIPMVIVRFMKPVKCPECEYNIQAVIVNNRHITNCTKCDLDLTKEVKW